MASKRKNRKEKKIVTAMEQLNRVLQAIIKAGGNIKNFFVRAAEAVTAPKWFKPHRDAAKFDRVRTDGIDKHLGYKIPPPVLALAEMVLAPSPAAA